MSSNDKTRQKLVESMRKTKAGARKEPAATKPKEKSKSAKAVKSKNTGTAKKPVTNRVKKGRTDSYQSQERRVWPD